MAEDYGHIARQFRDMINQRGDANALATAVGRNPNEVYAVMTVKEESSAAEVKVPVTYGEYLLVRDGEFIESERFGTTTEDKKA